MKFGCAYGGSPWRSSLLSLYRVPRNSKLLPSLDPIADISNKKRKLVQTEGAKDENVKFSKLDKEGKTEDYIDDIAEDEEEDISEDSDMTGDEDDDDDELHDCDEDGGRRRRPKKKKKKSKGRSKRSRRGKKKPRIILSRKGPNTVLKRKGSKPKRVKTIHALSRGKGRSRPTPVLIT